MSRINVPPSKIVSYLKTLRWSQRDLAEELGVDEKTVRRWLHTSQYEMPRKAQLWLYRRAQNAIYDPPPKLEKYNAARSREPSDTLQKP
jgi:transcriptional regulator with XRE-family HTH domain